MGWRYGGGTRKVGGLWLAGVGEYRGVDGAGALAGRPPAGSCSCSRVGPALSLALARALALALALALGQGRSGAGRAGKWGWVGTAGKRYGERGAENSENSVASKMMFLNRFFKKGTGPNIVIGYTRS